MAEEKKTVKKTAAKPAGAKATSAAKSAAPKASAPKGSAPAKKSSSAAGGKITVKQTGSAARSEEWAYQTLMGLGLGRMNRVRTLEDTPAVRGMIARVHHLVTVQDAA